MQHTMMTAVWYRWQRQVTDFLMLEHADEHDERRRDVKTKLETIIRGT